MIARGLRKLHTAKVHFQHRLTWRTPCIAGEHSGVSFALFSGDEAELKALHSLLQRAYQVHLSNGHNFLAATADADQLRRRLTGAVCVTAWSEESLVGTICYRPRLLTSGSRWLSRARTAKFSLLAVHPQWQGKSLGRDLVAVADGLARFDGADHLALDTAAESWLCDYYARQGFRRIESVQWPHANYESAVLSRPVANPPDWLSIR